MTRRYTVRPPTEAQLAHMAKMRAAVAGRVADRVGPRREKVRILLREGRSVNEVADILGVSYRTIERDKKAMGWPPLISDPFTWTARAEWLCRSLIADGCPVNEIARSIGSSFHAVIYRFRAELEARGPVEIIGGRHHQMAVEMDLRLTDARAVI